MSTGSFDHPPPPNKKGKNNSLLVTRSCSFVCLPLPSRALEGEHMPGHHPAVPVDLRHRSNHLPGLQGVARVQVLLSDATGFSIGRPAEMAPQPSVVGSNWSSIWVWVKMKPGIGPVEPSMFPCTRASHFGHDFFDPQPFDVRWKAPQSSFVWSNLVWLCVNAG